MSIVMVRQHYKSSLGIFPTYIDALPKRLTLNRGFVAKRFDRSRQTLFQDVSVIKPRHVIAQDVRTALGTQRVRKETVPAYLSRMLETLKEIVFAQWKPDYAHAIFHSSGIDSRLLSWAIRELWKEHGDDWLGQVLFLCSKWEGSEFKRIMAYEEWDPSQYWVVDEDLPSPRYYEWSLTNFKGAWERHNGVSAIAVNLFWYPIAKAQARGILPTEQVQVFSGQWGNTTMDEVRGEDIKTAIIMFYFSVLRNRPFKGDLVHFPFAEAQYVQAALSSQHALGHALRPALLKHADERLAKFTNMRADGDRHRRIADDIIEQMIEDYDNSWYGKYIKPGARPKHKTTEFQSFCSHWTAASLCNELLARGHTIRR